MASKLKQTVSRKKSTNPVAAKVTGAGKIYIKASRNNTIITGANAKGETVGWQSGGRYFKNSRKSTSEAAEVAGKKLGEYLKSLGMGTVAVYLNGVGQGREGALRGLVLSGLTVSHIHDVTGIAHNGVKKKKQQRK